MRRVFSVVAALLCLIACNPTEGPLLFHSGASDGGSTHAATALVRAGMSVQYQITGSVDTSVDAQLFVVDLFDATARQVGELRAQGRVVIAYVSVGSFEPWRDDASAFPKTAIGMTLAGYPEESWLDIRDGDVRAAMQARFDRARDKGFDGVFVSTLGGYMQTSGFPLARADELDYVHFLASAAAERGLSAGLSGDFELGATVADQFDWALDIDCVASDSCDELATFVAQDKAVFDLETSGERDAVCAKAAMLGIPTTLKHASFDAWRVSCT